MTTLLVAAAGGHLKQLNRLLPRLRGVDDDVMWVTFDNAQSRSLLAGEEVLFATYPAPRDIAVTARNAGLAAKVLAKRRFSSVVSTGSSIALSFLPLAAVRGASCHYIESATRIEGPSMTGRVLRWSPRIHLYCQYRSWAHPPWKYRGSVFDGFTASSRPDARPGPPATVKRVVVTVGGTEVYGFRRLIERMVAIVPPDVEVLWQTGNTEVSDLPIKARRSVPGAEMEEALARADAVVCHAGIGSALSALEAGRCPILVPRQKAFGENVDDHQDQIAAELSSRGLALQRRPDELEYEDLVSAASVEVGAASDPPPFELDH